MSILFPFLNRLCPACSRRLDLGAELREEIDKALSGFRPAEAGPHRSRVFVAWCAVILEELARKIIEEESLMAFETVESNKPFVPAKLGNFLLGRVLGIGTKDTNDKAKFLLVQTSNPPKTPGDEGPDGKREKFTFRVTDADLVRAFEARVGGAAKAKDYDADKRDDFLMLEVTGFKPGDTAWPEYKVAFSSKVEDLSEELGKRGGIAYQLDARVNPNAAKGDGGGSSTATPAVKSTKNHDDIPF